MSPPNRVAQALGTKTDHSPAPPGSAPPTPPSAKPVPPKSPFGNMPVSTGSGEVRFKSQDISRLGDRLVTDLGDDLSQARRHVNAAPREVEAQAFTTFCAHLAHAYVQGTEYADVDLVTKLRHLKEFQDGLKTTAKVVQMADDKSAPKTR
ncbi:hypothetical protein E1264_36180 [Actinomadura sp. KC216]|uniref:hypothetical protein n=1 Tax=Actinomadura sp. KC216 TaxID=2530370 RepID=UPI0010495AAB|nr:hypothetical protein [Actinomadura sp. KC216]TDB78975.1 hypothetical protein E1264_36180 [Actinomadura sp. KC216]